MTPVNDPPVGLAGQVAVSIPAQVGTSHTFSRSDFGFTDPTDQPTPNAFLNVRFTSALSPATGTLTYNGTPVTATTVVPAADLDANKLVYTAPATVGPDASFSFQVQDNGGTANGGVDTDLTVRTITLHVTTGPNQAPSGTTSSSISTNEDTTYTIGQADFGFSDPDGNNFQTVKFGTINLIGGGTLQNNGVNVTSGSAVPVSDILLGKLRYTPPADQHASPQITIAFQVQDNGGTDNGGVDTDPTPNTLSINVNSISDGPTSANFTKGISEGQTQSFTAGDFTFGDPKDSPADAFTNVIITSLPTAGTLTLSGGAVAQGQPIPVGQLNNLVFTPPPSPTVRRTPRSTSRCRTAAAASRRTSTPASSTRPRSTSPP